MIDGNAVNSDCTHKHYGKKAALAQVSVILHNFTEN